MLAEAERQAQTTEVPLLKLLTLFGFILLPVFGLMFSQSEKTISQFVCELLVSTLFFVVPFFFFLRNVKLYFYLLLPFAIISPLLFFAILEFQLAPDHELLGIIMQTNVNESMEFLASYASFIPWFILYLLIYLRLLQTVPNRIYFPRHRQICVLACGILVGLIYYDSEFYKKSINKFFFLELHYYPTSLLRGSYMGYDFARKSNINRSKHFSFNASKAISNEREIYVFILGETARYDHFQLNGYSRPTNPRLSLRSNLKSFSNVVSGSNLTFLSVPQIITRADPTNLELQFTEKSFISAIKEAGFRTVWLSNQSRYDLWSGTIISHAREADISIFSPNFTIYSDNQEIYDQRLLHLLDSVIAHVDENLFVVMHTLGSHWNYRNRYPKQFEYFTTNTDNKKQNIINAYDNSIRYTDFIIDSTIAIVEGSNSLSSVVYISDHGEDLFDNDNTNIFHLHPSKSTLHIPLFIWTSAKYDRTYPHKIKGLYSNLDKRIGAENIFYTVLNLANINFELNRPELSITDTLFQNSPQFYFDYKLKTFNTLDCSDCATEPLQTRNLVQEK